MSRHPRRTRVFMMDLLAIVPYYTAYLSRALLREHVDLTVGSITYYLDPDCFRSRQVPLHPGFADVVGRFPLPKLPRRLLKLVEAVLNLFALSVRFLFARPDILHVQYLPMLRWPVPIDWLFVKFWRARGAKVVLTVHDLLPHDTAARYKELFTRLYSSVDRLICHSDHIAARLQSEFHVPPERIDVIAHGPFFYDLPVRNNDAIVQSFGLSGADPLFLWQGIIFPYKGIDLLLDAWQKVETELPRARLIIAGTGSPDLLDQIREQSRRLDLKRVQFEFRFITTEELVSLYRVANVLIYPYRNITTSGALATGLALGKTIVASDLPVFRELLRNDHNALLVDPTLPDQLASTLTRLGDDPTLRIRLAQEVVNMNFGDQTWQTIAQRTITTYNAALHLNNSTADGEQREPVSQSVS